MQYARLGQTGLSVSRLCLGTMTLGYQCDEPLSRSILDAAADGGVTFIDTADVYPFGGGLELAGRTEEIVGRWLNGQRSKFIIATKAVGRMGAAPWDIGASRKHLLDAVDASLRRLDTDHIDLYQLHSDDRTTPLDETLEALDAIRRSGKVRYLGVSNFLAYRLARALGRAEMNRWSRFVSVQPRYSLLFRQVERELFPLALEEGLGVMVYNPLAGGLLTGKHRVDADPPPNSRFAIVTPAADYKGRYWHEREFATVDALREATADCGRPMATVAVAWVLANPAVTSAIIGASRPEQLADSLAAVDLRLDPALKARLDALTAEYRCGDATR